MVYFYAVQAVYGEEASGNVKYSLTSGGGSAGTDGCTVKVSEQTCIVKGLTSENTYYFTVRATNEHSGQVDSKESEGISRSIPTLSLLGGNKQVTPTFASQAATFFDLSYGESSGVYGTTKTGAISGVAYRTWLTGRLIILK